MIRFGSDIVDVERGVVGGSGYAANSALEGQISSLSRGLGRLKGKTGYEDGTARREGAAVEGESTYWLRALYRSRAQSRLQFSMRLTRGTDSQSPRPGRGLSVMTNVSFLV